MHTFGEFRAATLASETGACGEQTHAIPRSNQRHLAASDVPAGAVWHAIHVAHVSADVWANRNFFYRDNAGRPTVIAGVPPDYSSATGQR